jgi:ATP-binding cassette subfamily B protein
MLKCLNPKRHGTAMKNLKRKELTLMSDTTSSTPVNEKKVKDPINLLYMVRKMYPIWFKSNPAYATVNALLAIVHGVSHAVNTMMTQLFFDAVYNVYLGKTEFKWAVIWLLLYSAAYLATNVLNAVHNFTTQQHWQRTQGIANVEIARKSSLINPAEYENPKRLDDINKAEAGAGSACQFVFTTLTLVVFYLPYFLFMALYLHNLKPTLIFALLLVFVPVLASQIMRSSIFSKLEDKAAPFRREHGAYREDACGGGAFKETRILGTFTLFNKLFKQAINSLNAAEWHAQKRSTLISALFNTLSLIGYGGILFMLVKYLLAGEITVGAFAAVFGSIGMLFGIMEEAITRHVGNVANNFGQIRNFIRFLEIPERKGGTEPFDKKGDIVVENANFRYPNAENDSLKGINLTVKAGETIAIVGENGAGKTTLVKLIMGLYNPIEGKVTINGRDVSDVNYRTLFEGVSGIYQKYQRYALTLRENIQLSDFNADKNDKDIDETLVKNGIDKEDTGLFPDGIETMLSREYESESGTPGVELSGGQWQRVAIARGFYRDSDIIVLDEPTAAIDPIEESKIYAKFVEITRGKTSIIVTHRMGSAKIAERIVVMKDGEIAQIGSHDELLKQGGAYADMYASQSGWYGSQE